MFFHGTSPWLIHTWSTHITNMHRHAQTNAAAVQEMHTISCMYCVCVCVCVCADYFSDSSLHKKMVNDKTEDMEDVAQQTTQDDSEPQQ